MYQRLTVAPTNKVTPTFVGTDDVSGQQTVGHLLDAFLAQLAPLAELSREAKGHRRRFPAFVSRGVANAVRSSADANPLFISLRPEVHGAAQAGRLKRRREAKRAQARLAKKEKAPTAAVGKKDHNPLARKGIASTSNVATTGNAKKRKKHASSSAMRARTPSKAAAAEARRCRVYLKASCASVFRASSLLRLQCELDERGTVGSNTLVKSGGGSSSCTHLQLTAGDSNLSMRPRSRRAKAVSCALSTMCCDAVRLREIYVARILAAVASKEAATAEAAAAAVTPSNHLWRFVPLFGISVRLVRLQFTHPPASKGDGGGGDGTRTDWTFDIVQERCIVVYETSQVIAAGAVTNAAHKGRGTSPRWAVLRATKRFPGASGTRKDLIYNMLTTTAKKNVGSDHNPSSPVSPLSSLKCRMRPSVRSLASNAPTVTVHVQPLIIVAFSEARCIDLRRPHTRIASWDPNCLLRNPS